MYALYNNIVSDIFFHSGICVDFLGTHMISLVLFFRKPGVTHRESDHFQRRSREERSWPDTSGHRWPDAVSIRSLTLSTPRARSRHVSTDRTREQCPPCIRSTFASSVRSIDLDRDRATSPPLTGHTCPASGQLQWASELHQLCHPWSNVPTTKCITMCMCVSKFSQTFLRVLAFH
jgi:hypothetical protein